MKKSKSIIIVGSFTIVILVGVGIYSLIGNKTSGNSAVTKRGTIETVVTSRGEINGEKSILISLPDPLKDNELRVWGFKINDLVEEGKKVKKGEFIAQLDQSELMNNMRERMTEKERVDADLKNAIIDSTVNLTAKREEITNALLDLQYKQIDLDMSKYESGAQQRKAQMAYQKAQIELDKKKRDFQLEQNKQKVKIRRDESNSKRLQNLLDKYRKAMGLIRITSPGDGIVMISEDFMGKKLTKDSRVYSWGGGTLATLPDMSSAIVETFVKEIDITKVGLGDSVQVLVDALPEKAFSGKVTKIANMGEDKSGFDMKVFEVVILLDHTDPDLKPGMTCNADIVVGRSEDAVLIPVESVFSSDSGQVAYVKKGGKVICKDIEVGVEDETNIVVLKGLEEGERVLLFNPNQEDGL